MLSSFQHGTLAEGHSEGRDAHSVSLGARSSDRTYIQGPACRETDQTQDKGSVHQTPDPCILLFFKEGFSSYSDLVH